MRAIEKSVDGRLSVREAAGLLQRSERQVQRLKPPLPAQLRRLGAAWQLR